MKKEPIILKADPADPEDFDATREARPARSPDPENENRSGAVADGVRAALPCADGSAAGLGAGTRNAFGPCHCLCQGDCPASGHGGRGGRLKRRALARLDRTKRFRRATAPLARWGVLTHPTVVSPFPRLLRRRFSANSEKFSPGRCPFGEK